MAGATGYLGRHIVKELQTRNLDFAAIARDPKKLKSMGVSEQQISVGEVTGIATSLVTLLLLIDSFVDINNN